MSSQTLEMVTWGPYKDLEKNTTIQKIIGNDADGFYAVSSEGQGKLNRSHLWLEYYSNLMVDLEARNEIILPSVSGVSTEFEQMYYIDKKLILFTTATNKETSTKTLYVQYLEQNGQLKNKPKKIGSIPIGNEDKDGFTFSLAEDKSKIVVSFHNTFMEYNDEPFTYVIMDTNLQIEFNEAFVLPFKSRKFDIIKSQVGNSGFIYMFAKLVQESKKKGKSDSEEKYEYKMLVYNNEKAEIKPYDITLVKYFPTDATFALNSKEEIVISGFFSGKTQKYAGEFIGAFYQIIDPRTEKVLPAVDAKAPYLVFDKTFIAENSLERNTTLPENYNNYVIKNLFPLTNGGYVLLAENYFMTEKKFVDPKTKEEIVLKYHNYNDIIAVGVNKDGKMDWAKRIPKNQVSLDDDGYYSSFAAICELTKTKIIFNDQKSNASKVITADKVKELKFLPEKAPKATAFVVTLYSDGSFEKDVVFSGKDAKNVFVPRLFYSNKENHITYGQLGKKYKFGTFSFE